MKFILAILLLLYGCDLDPSSELLPDIGRSLDATIALNPADMHLDPIDMARVADIGADVDPAVDGRTLFMQHCAGCHGPEGRGGAAWPNSIRTMTEIYDVVRDGRRAMPPFPQLTAADVHAIEEYLADAPDNDAGLAADLGLQT